MGKPEPGLQAGVSQSWDGRALHQGHGSSQSASQFKGLGPKGPTVPDRRQAAMLP